MQKRGERPLDRAAAGDDRLGEMPILLRDLLDAGNRGKLCHVAFLTVDCSTREGYDPRRSARQQLGDLLVDKAGVFGVEYRVAGEVTPDRRDRPQLRLWHPRHLAAVVLDGEIKIALAWHDDRIGGDRGKRPVEIAAIKLVGADVSVLP